MTKCFARNENNDIYINNLGDLAVVSDLEAVLQACEHVAKTRLGELVLSIEQGIPYLELVFSGIPNFQQFEAALRDAFLSVVDVVEVVSLIMSQDADQLSYTAVIRTIYGTGAING